MILFGWDLPSLVQNPHFATGFRPHHQIIQDGLISEISVFPSLPSPSCHAPLRYYRLYESHKKLSRVNQGLEDKLLSVVSLVFYFSSGTHHPSHALFSVYFPIQNRKINIILISFLRIFIFIQHLKGPNTFRRWLNFLLMMYPNDVWSSRLLYKFTNCLYVI